MGGVGLESIILIQYHRHPLTEMGSGTLPSKWHLEFIFIPLKMQAYAAMNKWIDPYTPQSKLLILIANI